MYEETQEYEYWNATVRFLDGAMPGGDVPYTTCGLIYRDRWGSCRHACK